MTRETLQIVEGNRNLSRRARSLLLAGCTSVLFASCAVDDRSLLSERVSAGGGSAGRSTSTAGDGGETTAQAGVASGGSGEAPGSAGSAGAAAGGDTGVDPAECPDLDQNSVPDCTETLLENTTFDKGASSWLPEDNVTQTWAEDDADERPGSGSLAIVNYNFADIPNFSIGGSKQCVPIADGGWYLFQANVLIATGQGSKGSGGFTVQFFESGDCSGKLMPNFGGTSQLVDEQGAWLPLRFQTESPSNAGSMSVEVVVVKGFKESALTVLFDNVLVKRLEQ